MLPSAASVSNRPADAVQTVGSPRVVRWQRIELVAAATELVVLFAPTVAWLFERWTASVWDNAHGLLIVPVVGYFAYQELKPLAHLPARGSAWGLAILVPALALHALDAAMHSQLLSAVALWLALPGLSLLLLGVPRTKALLFPLAFLAFALPIPLAFTEQIHWNLRLMVTEVTGTVVPWFGIPVFVEGTTIHLPKGPLEIADACSGFSTLYAAAAVACLTAYSAQRVGRRILVLLAAAPIAIAANLLRVILLTLLVVWYGKEVLETVIHPLSGMATFAIALPVIFWLGGESK
jgi:exosortase